MQGRNVVNKWRTPAVQRIMKDHEGTKCRRVIVMLRGNVSTFVIQSLLLRIFFLCEKTR